MVSRARCLLNVTMCTGSSEIAESFFFRGRRKASTSASVIASWRTVLALVISRGFRCRVCVSGSEIARRFDSSMFSRVATQKAAGHASQAALASVCGAFKSVTGSTGGKIGWNREIWSVPQRSLGRGVEDSPDRVVVAHIEQDPKVSHSA